MPPEGHLKRFSPLRLLIPVLLGMGVTFVLFHHEFDREAIGQLKPTAATGISLLLSVLCMAGRDFGLSYRFRLMGRKDGLSWWQSVRTNWLCEFTSAATPSAVGGSGFIILFLHREGIPLGKGTAITIASLFLDELFFVLAYPCAFLFFTTAELFGEQTAFTGKLRIIFFIVYFLISAWTLILYLALFHFPEYAGSCIRRLFRLPGLKRWAEKGEQLSETLCISSGEMKTEPFLFWIKAFLATIFAWSCRYLAACALFAPFIPAGLQPIVFIRQLILWIIMTVSPTPGGSGLSEYAFSAYYSDLPVTAEAMLFVIVCWRLVTYYAYLFIGINILPGWFKKTHRKTTTGDS